MFISILYMFRAVMCSSSGESIVSIRHLVHVTLCSIWYACLDGTPWSCIQTYIPDGHIYRVTYTKYRIDIIDSPDDEHMTVRNV